MVKKHKYPYPLVECDDHPGPQHSYAVCLHVMAGAAVGLMAYATQTEMGQCLCEACAKAPPPVTGLKLWCGAHLAEWLDRKRHADN